MQVYLEEEAARDPKGRPPSKEQIASAVAAQLRRADGNRMKPASVSRELRYLLADPPTRTWDVALLEAFCRVVRCDPADIASPSYEAILRRRRRMI